MVVVFLLRGLHNEAGNTKFRNVRQYIAHMGHVGVKRNIKVHVHGVNIGFLKQLNGSYTCQVICNNEDYVRWRLRSFRSAQSGKSQKDQRISTQSHG